SALNKLSDYLYEIPKSFRKDMRVPARVYTSEHMLSQVVADRSLWQLINVATLPGIQKYSLAMPDIHEGYGFPIGGVAAMAIDEDGVISPGGIGYDINCGVRLLSSDLPLQEVKPHLETIANQIFHSVPSGVGRSGSVKLKLADLDKVLEQGAPRMVELGFGTESDLEACESNGHLADAMPLLVSEHAKDRGKDQLGTLGSGNHFLEIQVVDEIFDQETANVFGLKHGYVTAMIHCGSRGLGHQVCTDYVRDMLNANAKWRIDLIDRQLACAPFHSAEGQNYFMAMKACANFAWANRHLIGHRIREAFLRVFGQTARLNTVYDVAHNIGKVETHDIDGVRKKVVVHRKGATRAFGPKQRELGARFKATGQPVLIPGTMGTASYVLAGAAHGMTEAFGSACHGAGRAMSRHAAKKLQSGAEVKHALANLDIRVFTDAMRGLAEEAPYAYKDIEEVVSVVDGAELARKVARLRPLAVVKGD
ncbi:MAG TPA: RtcB family protein, partial [Myxococcota bacterium]|nr:RtcB family protein [Myxococcota bacterium]